jgi:hypothetical protein
MCLPVELDALLLSVFQCERTLKLGFGFQQVSEWVSE